MYPSGVNTNYIYDDLGRVILEIESNGTTKEFTYDAGNNRKSFIIKQNGSLIMNTTYEYDNMNRLYKTYENGQLVATYTYDTNGNRDTLTYGNGVSTKYDYNLANKMKTLTNKNSAGAALSKFDYTYYLDGNQASKSDSEGVTSYKYDGLSRISSVEGPNGLYKNYGYDDSNNRLYLSGNDEIFINDTDISYKYDGFNQLRSAVNQTTTTYSYNGDGIRTSKNVGGILTTHILDGGNVAADISSTITKYVRGINLICSEINGQRYYYLYNGHGDVVQIVDNSGSIVNNYKYDEWGNIVTQTEGINNPFKYCGEYFDKETGLIYLRARYYDPKIGRFINEDSFLGNDRDPLSLNLYTYCGSNPMNLWDATGHRPTADEAAYMAAQIYENGKEADNLIGGWKFWFVTTGGDGMKMGVYSRTKDDGTEEYALVSKGTNSISNWKNNFQQVVGKSADMKTSIDYAREFVENAPDFEITFVGHSKGGAEAAANAVATNRDAILFNPASVNLGAYNLDYSSYTADMTAYIVKGEALNAAEGWMSEPIGSAVYLPQQHGGKWYDLWQTSIVQAIKNHSMDSVKNALKEWEAKK